MARIAFLGLGVMGAPMARHLAQAGHDLIVYNRGAVKAEAWVAGHGGRAARSAAEAASGADAIIACVGHDGDVEQVTLGPDGAFAAMAEGALFVDHTTVSARLARRLAEDGERRGLHVVDAPVSGGQAGAEQGKLAIMCGGSEAAVAAAQPLMQA
jgi:3-hydroxyisobutyrate dehydrogenase